jgi:hypothetical protein
MWVGMSNNLREKYKSIKEMEQYYHSESLEAKKRGISLKQWLNLLDIAEVSAINEKEWIDKNFQFKNGKIVFPRHLSLIGYVEFTSLPENLEVLGFLNLMNCKGLTSLPKGLKVGESLGLAGCTGLTSLPKDLSVFINLWLSEDLNEQVKKDAERLKHEGKIKGEILYQ